MQCWKTLSQATLNMTITNPSESGKNAASSENRSGKSKTRKIRGCPECRPGANANKTDWKRWWWHRFNRRQRQWFTLKGTSRSETLGNLRDQGFARPKVLILVPVRASVENYVNLILKYLPSTITNIKNRQKFDAEFGVIPENDILDDQGRRKSEYTRDGRRRPEEWIEMFAKNNDDFFRLGISINRKSCILYSDFYESDIILASPLGLRLLTGADGQVDDTKHVDSDFLSSIEVLILDQACGMLMQNWKHVQDVLAFTNAIPVGTGSSGDKGKTDFSRILPYFWMVCRSIWGRQ